MGRLGALAIMNRLSYDLWERIFSAVVHDLSSASIHEPHLCTQGAGTRGRLLSFLLVSRSAAKLVLPFLWSHITLGRPRQLEALAAAASCSMAGESHVLLGSLIHHLDIFTLCSETDIAALLGHTSALTTLHLMKPTPSLVTRPVMTGLEYPPLRHLTSLGLLYGVEERAYRVRDILDLGALCPNLEVLFVAIVEADDESEALSQGFKPVIFNSLHTLKIGSPVTGRRGSAQSREKGFQCLLHELATNAVLPRLSRLDVYEAVGDLSLFLQSLRGQLEVLVLQFFSWKHCAVPTTGDYGEKVHTLVVRDTLIWCLPTACFPSLERFYVRSDWYTRWHDGLTIRPKLVPSLLFDLPLEGWKNLKVIGFVAGPWEMGVDEERCKKHCSERGISLRVNATGM